MNGIVGVHPRMGPFSFLIVIALVACGSKSEDSAKTQSGSGKDKCERVVAREVELLAKATGSGLPGDHASSIAQCRARLRAEPEFERYLDCILATDGPMQEGDAQRCKAKH
jgi:hypothetical protein